ncbi:thiamine phosphate synthase [Parabacteroides sp. PF5-9]|uniref:thiamine phosphate synthase n=1 Tax=Parabacteroides sp. PF5-9 TaxID=1742404 RepID=UPI0024742C9A|nr:thiamine phosphate synthase [Parabacteroides sp. PF5-9]MDH6356590.1 thiamine-phosphate pyrophosphorylase [Parabacteroides sp. PF5-9]
MKQLIVITTPDLFAGEEEIVRHLFDEGLEILHLRKPEAGKNELIKWLDRIPADYHSRIVLHEHFDLTTEYSLKGIHLNRRYPTVPDDYNGSTSRSIHSFNEITDYAPYQYVFLSPIFSSISKKGYESKFSISELKEAFEKGILHEKVVALGGITVSTIPFIHDLPFGGYGVLGSLWGNKPTVLETDTIIQQFHRLQICL